MVTQSSRSTWLTCDTDILYIPEDSMAGSFISNVCTLYCIYGNCSIYRLYMVNM